MTEQELFAATEDAYSSFIHLQDGLDESLARISACVPSVSDSLIDHLIQDGDSWRERLLGLVLAAIRGIDQFYDSLIIGLNRTGGISIVPMFAAKAVAVRECGCGYTKMMTASLDRNRWDGEVGFSLDWFHYLIGIGDAPREAVGPNFGQDFSKHFEFYSRLNQHVNRRGR